MNKQQFIDSVEYIELDTSGRWVRAKGRFNNKEVTSWKFTVTTDKTIFWAELGLLYVGG